MGREREASEAAGNSTDGCDTMIRDSHLDTRNKLCILMNAIVPQLECRRTMGREREVGETAGNSTDASS